MRDGAQPQRAGLATEAIQVLRGLQSVTTAGVTYQNYAARVLEAKVKVDEYLRQAQADKPELRAAIERSLGYYVLASSAWNAKITGQGDHASLARSPLVAQCPRLKSQVDAIEADPTIRALRSVVPGKPPEDESVSRGKTIAFGGVPSMWQCASETLSHAESLLGNP